MKDNLSFLSSELVRMLEKGIEKQLSRSIFYSPFRLFYRLFKRNNPQLIQRVKDSMARDIAEVLSNIEHFNPKIFMEMESPTDEGRILMKRAYNIGIRVVKSLSVKLAFKAFQDQSLQQEIYNYILTQTRDRASLILIKFLTED